MDARLADLRERLFGNPRRDMANDSGPISVARRLEVVQFGTEYSLDGPTAMHREVFGIAKRAYAELRDELNQLVTTDLPALEKQLEDVGVPWTPGRAVPIE